MKKHIKIYKLYTYIQKSKYNFNSFKRFIKRYVKKVSKDFKYFKFFIKLIIK